MSSFMMRAAATMASSISAISLAVNSLEERLSDDEAGLALLLPLADERNHDPSLLIVTKMMRLK